MYRLLGKVLFHDAADGDDQSKHETTTIHEAEGEDFAVGSIPLIARGDTPIEYLVNITEPQQDLVNYVDDDDDGDFDVDDEEEEEEEEHEEEEGEEEEEEEEEEFSEEDDYNDISDNGAEPSMLVDELDPADSPL